MLQRTSEEQEQTISSGQLQYLRSVAVAMASDPYRAMRASTAELLRTRQGARYAEQKRCVRRGRPVR
jgi:hypothetical protein